jgi:hypothetical protein
LPAVAPGETGLTIRQQRADAPEKVRREGPGKEASLVRNEGLIAESQLSELRNMRVLLEEARVIARDLAYHRRARVEAVLGRALDEVDRQIEDLRIDQG